MKKYAVGVGALLIAFAAFSFKGGSQLEIGDKAPMIDKKMEDISGKDLSLKEMKDDNGLLVVFSCNTCPFVIGWEDAYPQLGKLTSNNKVGMVLVNSNEAKRKGDDSMDAMKEHYKEAGYNSKYVLDAKHELADAFGAKTTPHVFLFDKNMKLVYRGTIDDRYEGRNDKPSKHYLKDAINAMLDGKKIEPAFTKQIGCSIKRVKA